MHYVNSASAASGPMPFQNRSRSSPKRLNHYGTAGTAMTFLLNKVRLPLALVFLLIAGNAFAQPFTYTYFPSNTTINSPVTTDLAIVGYAGGTYNDDFTRNFTGPSSPTVAIGMGADIPDAEVFNSSVVNVTGGSVAAFMYDTAKLNISGGNVPVALSFSSAEMNVTGGTVDDIEGQGRRINVSGGTIHTLVANSQTDPFGENLGSCVVNVTGGIFTSEIIGYNDGIVNLRGGSILGAKLKAADGATLNIYGSDLTAQLVDPNAPNGYSLYTVSGLLSDGSPLDGVELRVRNDGVTYGHSSFNLIDVPEPGTVGVLALVGLLAACRRHRVTRSEMQPRS